MALSTALLRPAASIAVRLFRPHQNHHHHFTPLLYSLRRSITSSSSLVTRGANSARPPTALTRQHSSSPPEEELSLADDGDLIELIDSEIKDAEGDDHGQIPFEIQDDEGKTYVTLRTKYRDESIEIEVYMPLRDRDVDVDEDSDEAWLPIYITITNPEGNALEFDCSGSIDELSIDEVYYRSKDASKQDDDRAYGGPGFENLDEDMQEGFYNYLERRGISDRFMKLLHRYMSKKSSMEYLNWLKNVKQFIGH